MTRHPSDENILLLTHGELSAWPALWTQGHLRRCPQCQARYAAFARTSAVLAAELRDPKGTPWQPAAPLISLRFVMVSLTAFLLLGALGGWFYFAVHSRPTPPAPRKQARPASDGCAPNLPDDRCR